MSIEYWLGHKGPTIMIESNEDMNEALNILHTQVIDNIGKDSQMIPVLEKAMEEVAVLGDHELDHRGKIEATIRYYKNLRKYHKGLPAHRQKELVTIIEENMIEQFLSNLRHILKTA